LTQARLTQARLTRDGKFAKPHAMTGFTKRFDVGSGTFEQIKALIARDAAIDD